MIVTIMASIILGGIATGLLAVLTYLMFTAFDWIATHIDMSLLVVPLIFLAISLILSVPIHKYLSSEDIETETDGEK